MPNIIPVSELQNYDEVLKDVHYGERVYLTRNGHGEYAVIDIKELDELDKAIAYSRLIADLQRAEEAEKRAQSRLEHPTDDLDIKRAEIALKKALVRINVKGLK